jgi:hypothetical protein
VLYGWVAGTADIDSQPVDLHQRQLEAYIDQLAALHTLDLDALDLDWMPRPTDARDCALAHAEAVWDQMGAMALEPLSTFGINWLRWHAPESVERLSVLHGDAGVGNFLVTGDELHGVIDWEWGHIGDPMEDLGSVAMHAGFHPVGDLHDAFVRYEKTGGITVDDAKVRYYAAHLYIRSVIALSAHVAHLDPHNPVALNLAYKLVNDRLTCEAIADALGATLDAPSLPDEGGDDDAVTLYDVVVANLVDAVAPATTSAFARDRAEMSARLVEMLARHARWGDEIAAIERAELSELLGEPVDELEDGLALARASPSGDSHVRSTSCVTHRRAVRAEWSSSGGAALPGPRHREVLKPRPRLNPAKAHVLSHRVSRSCDASRKVRLAGAAVDAPHSLCSCAAHASESSKGSRVWHRAEEQASREDQVAGCDGGACWCVRAHRASLRSRSHRRARRGLHPGGLPQRIRLHVGRRWMAGRTATTPGWLGAPKVHRPAVLAAAVLRVDCDKSWDRSQGEIAVKVELLKWTGSTWASCVDVLALRSGAATPSTTRTCTRSAPRRVARASTTRPRATTRTTADGTAATSRPATCRRTDWEGIDRDEDFTIHCRLRRVGHRARHRWFRRRQRGSRARTGSAARRGARRGGRPVMTDDGRYVVDLGVARHHPGARPQRQGHRHRRVARSCAAAPGAARATRRRTSPRLPRAMGRRGQVTSRRGAG